MPRNVRPSWVSVKIDPTSNDPAPVAVAKGGTGPKGRAGTLSVDLKARIGGAVVDFLKIDAIGSADGTSTLFRIVDRRTGRTLFEEKVAQ